MIIIFTTFNLKKDMNLSPHAIHRTNTIDSSPSFDYTRLMQGWLTICKGCQSCLVGDLTCISLLMFSIHHSNTQTETTDTCIPTLSVGDSNVHILNTFVKGFYLKSFIIWIGVVDYFLFFYMVLYVWHVYLNSFTPIRTSKLYHLMMSQLGE